MRTSLALATLSLALIAGAGSVAAPAPAPLLPLTEADMASSKEMGCTFSFFQGRKTYIQLINRELMIRTPAGLQVCHITEAQSDLMNETKGSVSCAGRTLAVRSTGRATANPEADSSSGPGLLTVKVGKSSTPIRGAWGTAC